VVGSNSLKKFKLMGETQLLPAVNDLVMSDWKPTSVEEYIKAAPDYAQGKLNEIRSVLKSVAPKASEELKWRHPVFIENRILFSYAAFKNHLTFMPTGPSFVV
jgi:uncharacterized protein YdhG (YjbR/CyaY superfamily)